MEDDDVRAIVACVREALGMINDAETTHAIEAVFEALGERMTADEAELVARYLPPVFGSLLTAASERKRTDEGLSEVVAGVAAREDVPRFAAYETVKATCEVLASYLPDEAIDKLQADLPEELALLFVRRVTWTPPEVRAEEDAPFLPRMIAVARPGSAHPIADSEPESAHSHSVARNPQPHADTKLSSGRVR
jgi:uncharacterized protein (DUF2267 family)